MRMRYLGGTEVLSALLDEAHGILPRSPEMVRGFGQIGEPPRGPSTLGGLALLCMAANPFRKCSFAFGRTGSTRPPWAGSRTYCLFSSSCQIFHATFARPPPT